MTIRFQSDIDDCCIEERTDRNGCDATRSQIRVELRSNKDEKERKKGKASSMGTDQHIERSGSTRWRTL
jgi:hypothetical protein